MSDDPARAALEAALRADRGRLLAALIARTGDFQLAEDALQDATEAALVHWRRSGPPVSPQGWILRVGWRKALDRLRRRARDQRHLEAETVLAAEEGAEMTPEDIADDRLRLIFTCCHPALEPKSRIALTLRTIGGLTTAEIARAFLDSETAMGQRLSRAKAKIATAGIPFAIPGPELWAERLGSVLAVIYLIFNEGYSVGRHEAPVRTDLCEEAIFLARLVDVLRPGDAEIEGLLALLLLTHCRRCARHDAAGQLVPLQDQDTNLWDADQRQEGLDLLDRAIARSAPGPFQIKAAIAALHVTAGPAGTDWLQITALYRALLRYEPTAVVRLNLAVAIGEAGDLTGALAELGAVSEDLTDYQPYHAARAEFLGRAGRLDESIASYDRAITLATNSADAEFLCNRREKLRERWAS
ncbi:RNA polymerase [Tabrizicola sp. J26]|uniref:RNA polymerase sigma factor n=1 Tax=Alitabrizicola rongguiensis TaxID=2909234 RepID=UPI001F3061A3|nr:DUF6596 domain-containing protein [Tabrizicola rongguiensis]MCF1710133.1 RNA polymerase [Tabrizicola rongguiensis]